jgi:hypothetical protein
LSASSLQIHILSISGLLLKRPFEHPADRSRPAKQNARPERHVSLKVLVFVIYLPTGNNNIHRPSKTKSAPAPILIKFAGNRDAEKRSPAKGLG